MIIPVWALLVLVSACSRGPSVTLKQVAPNHGEILLADGSRVYIDVTVEKDMSVPPTDRDILLVTHAHFDHYNKDIADSFPGRKIIFTEGTLEGDGWRITSIPSGHNDTDPVSGELATNYLFVIETGGIRIAHLGDLGQFELTSEQLSALGQVDICYAQLENGFSNMSLLNKKGFKLIGQINPRYVFPTHYKERGLEYAIANYPTVTGGSEMLTLRQGAFPEKTTFILTGDQSAAYRKIYNLKALPGTD
jgi:hypothetical protein